ncbi:putative transposase/invertase (TIGR01784 family) [Treponema pedis]
MLINSFERDARNDGWKAGMQAGIAQGRSEGIALGFSDGARQKALETAKLMKQANCENNFIMQMTGLSLNEIEKL